MSPSNATVPVRVAAFLADLTEQAVQDLIRSGKARSETIRGTVYVDLDDVLAEGGAR